MQYNWQPIGVEINRSNSNVYCYFGGSYDGNGYTISNVHTPYGTTGAYCYQGLFGLTYTYTDSSPTIKNITMKNVDIRGDTYVGGIVGLWISSTGTIQLDNCSVDGNVYGDVGVGGVVGEASSREIGNIIMSDCLSNASVSASGNSVGGLVGSAKVLSTGSIRIENSVNYGSVQGDTHVGGIVGYASVNSAEIENIYIDDCVNYGSVDGESYVGGVAGSAYKYCVVTNSINYGSISGTDRVGGVVGRIYTGTSIENLVNYGSVQGDTHVGGVMGIVSHADHATSLINAGNVSGSLYVGGVIGYIYDGIELTNSINFGTVTGNDESVGGLVGIVENANVGSVIRNNGSEGAVVGTGAAYVGGLIGRAFGTNVIENNYANMSSTTQSIIGAGTINGAYIYILDVNGTTYKRYHGDVSNFVWVNGSDCPIPKDFSWAGEHLAPVTTSNLTSAGFSSI